MTDLAIETRAVVVERKLAHPPEKVWRALTQSALIEDWLMQNDFEPVVGRRFNLRMPGGPQWNGVTDCEVLVVEPPIRLAYTWCASGDEAAKGIQTVVTWTLTRLADGTELRMEQAGFRPEHEFNYRGATFGWQRFIGELERVVAGLD